MLVWNRVREQGDAQDGEEAEDEEEYGEIEVVHAADDRRALPVCQAGLASVGKLRHHPGEADQEPTSQPPEGPLRGEEEPPQPQFPEELSSEANLVSLGPPQEPCMSTRWVPPGRAQT